MIPAYRLPLPKVIEHDHSNKVDNVKIKDLTDTIARLNQELTACRQELQKSRRLAKYNEEKYNRLLKSKEK